MNRIQKWIYFLMWIISIIGVAIKGKDFFSPTEWTISLFICFLGIMISHHILTSGEMK